MRIRLMMGVRLVLSLAVILAWSAQSVEAQLQRIVLATAKSDSGASSTEASDVEAAGVGSGFKLRESGAAFQPGGFNYDHDAQGRLLEEYWEQEWPKVEQDFADMRRLGANVVRIHLQLGAFMESAEQPRASQLQRLQKLLALAEQNELYLNLTGLGCYHKQDVPAWYAALEEQARWQAQAKFWEAIAKTCRESSAVFCYDLMNEPVVPGGDQPRRDWLGPAFGGKHFVQAIALDRAGRSRPEIAREWIKTLTTAIRKQDAERLITVGLVPWSLDRPGLTSGFVPSQIADELDFLSVHLYPAQNKLEQELEILREFAAVKKPVVIEEIFPLRCDIDQLAEFIEKSRADADGWIGFYWGETPEQLRAKSDSIPQRLMLGWLEYFQTRPLEQPAQ